MANLALHWSRISSNNIVKAFSLFFNSNIFKPIEVKTLRLKLFKDYTFLRFTQ